MPFDEALEAAFARRVRPGVEVFMELALLDSLPRDKHDVVCFRLKVIDGYLERPDRGTKDAEAAAAELGLSLRSFYRLVERLAERGPVAALAPNFGRKQRSDAVTELSPEIEEILRANPTGGLVTVLRTIERELGGAGTKISESAVRRRLMALRAAAVVPPDGAMFGRGLLLDRIATDLVYAVGDGGPRRVVADLLVDEDTGYVVGVSMFEGDDVESLRRVLKDARRRIGLLSAYALRYARQPERLRWIISDALAETSAMVANATANMSPPVSFEPKTRGRFRFGSELVRIIGDTLGRTRLLVRATVDPEADGATDGVLDRSQALDLLLGAVSDHNRLRIRSLSRLPVGVVSRQRGADAFRLFNAIVTAFAAVSPEPWMTAIPSRRSIVDEPSA